ncbi:hypothetical protein AKJ66_03550 [candidate division MSBL1 archaeon SCGC-AAA259E22]|uniref:Bacterial repeat domain-containing protein n=1 Tax=candidate division MSBL1 archaeon SCGC-AAA259E22 TaxID=1698265 RepID=A0A133UEZ6_9EURY|nr:hypothetical protein AKJ66_03550 [candidate division MSBL1 archaeon SCGC-AAA259E22]
MRGGKYRVEASYEIYGENLDDLGSAKDSAWVDVQGPTPSLGEVENLLPDYPIEIKRKDGRTTVIIGSPPKTAAGKKEVKQWMHSFDRWLENTGWTDSLSDYGVYFGAPKEEKGYYKVGMNPLSPNLIANAFKEFREASLSADVGAFGESIPIAFSGNPEAPAIFHKISENRIETDRWAETIENHINYLYPPDDVGYEITSKSETRAEGYFYLEGKNDRVPFENFKLVRENTRWKVSHGSDRTDVRSPSENLKITGYRIDKSDVGSPEWSETHKVLVRIAPTVRNGSSYPGFVSSVHIKIENSTDTFTRSYPAGVVFVRRISLGIVPSRRTVEVGYQGGPAPLARWSSNGSKSFLRMSELAGENFQVTLTLKDGEGTTLAKRTFHVTFGDLSEKYRLTITKEGVGTVLLEPDPENELSYEGWDKVEKRTYEKGTEVRVRAVVGGSNEFEGWTGDVAENSARITVVMNSDKHIVAHFSGAHGMGIIRNLENVTTKWTYGTHVLVTDDEMPVPTDDILYALESDSIDLTKYEGKIKRIRGRVVHEGENGGPPFIDVTSVSSSNEPRGDLSVKYPSAIELPQNGAIWSSPQVEVKRNRVGVTWSLHENTECTNPAEIKENLTLQRAALEFLFSPVSSTSPKSFSLSTRRHTVDFVIPTSSEISGTVNFSLSIICATISTSLTVARSGPSVRRTDAASPRTFLLTSQVTIVRMKAPNPAPKERY